MTRFTNFPFQKTLAASALLGLLLISGCGSSSGTAPDSSSSNQSSSSAPADPEMTMLRTDGTRWVNAHDETVILRGTNLGNWLLQEFWMMGQSTDAVNDQCTLETLLDERFGRDERERLMTVFRDNWIRERDWDQMVEFGLNLVRLPFVWNLLEDEDN